MKRIQSFVFLLAFAAVFVAAVAALAGKQAAGDQLAMDKSATAMDKPMTERRYTKPSDAEIRKRLTKLQYEVTQEEGTERPFKNEFWDNKREGLYVDIVTGEPLFSSADKFKSGTGWPSFTRPVSDKFIATHMDRKFFMTRTEIKSKIGGSHLGHIFNDGPKPTGLRYCVNSASLRFIPAKKMAEQGYGEYRDLVKSSTPKPGN